MQAGAGHSGVSTSVNIRCYDSLFIIRNYNFPSLLEKKIRHALFYTYFRVLKYVCDTYSFIKVAVSLKRLPKMRHKKFHVV